MYCKEILFLIILSFAAYTLGLDSEYRQIYAHKVPNMDSSTREWRIIEPQQLGIRIDGTNIPNEYKNLYDRSVSRDVCCFLTQIAGDGGPWAGWTLHALGNKMYDTRGSEKTPYFWAVFERKLEEKERVGNVFEIWRYLRFWEGGRA